MTSISDSRGFWPWVKQRAEKYAGLLVLATVLAWLKGPWEAAVVIADQAAEFARAFVGTSNEQIGEVVLKTLPLVLTAAAITFLCLRRWFPAGLSGVYVGTFVILAAGWLGGALSSRLSVTTVQVASRSVTGADRPMEIGVAANHTSVSSSLAAGTVGEGKLPTVPMRAIRRAEPPLPVAAGRPKPVTFVPEGLPGVLGQLAKAVNQLAGYFWEYGLNLSIAAIILGAYFGWSWHRRLERVEAAVERIDDARQMAA